MGSAAFARRARHIRAGLPLSLTLCALAHLTGMDASAEEDRRPEAQAADGDVAAGAEATTEEVKAEVKAEPMQTDDGDDATASLADMLPAVPTEGEPVTDVQRQIKEDTHEQAGGLEDAVATAADSIARTLPPFVRVGVSARARELELTAHACTGLH